MTWSCSHMRKQRMLEEAECVIAMQRLWDCQGLCVAGRQCAAVPGAGASALLFWVKPEVLNVVQCQLSTYSCAGQAAWKPIHSNVGRSTSAFTHPRTRTQSSRFSRLLPLKRSQDPLRKSIFLKPLPTFGALLCGKDDRRVMCSCPWAEGRLRFLQQALCWCGQVNTALSPGSRCFSGERGLGFVRPHDSSSYWNDWETRNLGWVIWVC